MKPKPNARQNAAKMNKMPQTARLGLNVSLNPNKLNIKPKPSKIAPTTPKPTVKQNSTRMVLIRYPSSGLQRTD